MPQKQQRQENKSKLPLLVSVVVRANVAGLAGVGALAVALEADGTLLMLVVAKAVVGLEGVVDDAAGVAFLRGDKLVRRAGLAASAERLAFVIVARLQ